MIFKIDELEKSKKSKKNPACSVENNNFEEEDLEIDMKKIAKFIP